VPAGVTGAAADDGEPAVAVGLAVRRSGRDRVALGPGPGREVHRQVRVLAPDAQPGARGEVAERPAEQEVGAAIEAEVLKVDSRPQR
jgi:hypothetical protein